MLDESGQVLYVGKAKNLKKRVTSYFKRQLDAKTLQLVKQVHSISVTVTRNEREALLLESNLIKAEKPRYNVLFRDDKSYPFLKISVQDLFPRLSFHRGLKRGKDTYFGPYPSSRDAREALNVLQTIFKLRQCDDSFFKNRSRPCLQYQIKRCSAPCVGIISEEDYQKEVENACLFLAGKSKTIIQGLIQTMEDNSQELQFEDAARIRDKIALLRSIQENQIIFGQKEDMDVLGIALGEEEACVHVLMIREGRMLGSRQYFMKPSALLLLETAVEDKIIESFILQHYVSSEEQCSLSMPKIILLPYALVAQKALAALLSERKGSSVQLMKAARGNRLRWITMAKESATMALKGRLKPKKELTNSFQALKEDFVLEKLPEQLVCFDVSHSLGEATVVSCVVFGRMGPAKELYRRFNVRAKTKGDDLAALTEGLTRYLTRLKSEGQTFPEILIVDGGKGQLRAAQLVLKELQIQQVLLLAVAKGLNRKVGLETIYRLIKEKPAVVLLNPLAFQLILQIRDEAHRFAITGHRTQRAKARKTSSLEEISGIGSKRRQSLLQYFGGLQEVLQASAEELAKVPGISKEMSLRLYGALHGN